jgi:DNA polymerase III delta prime subunit
MVNFSNFPTIAAPKTIADIAFESAANAKKMQSIVSGTYGFPGNGKNGIILHGKYGAGKSTTATLIPDAMEQTSIGMNCPWRTMHRIMSNNNGVGFLTEIDDKCYTVNINGKYAYVILDEVDNLSPSAMQQLKSVMDNHINRVVFIMTTNHLQKIDSSLEDRSYIFGFNKVPPSAWLPAMRRVLAAYGITCLTDDQLIAAAASINGSGRQFATCVKELIEGYYEMFPHLLPPHLQLSHHNTAPIAVAQPLPVLPAIPSVLQVNTVSTTAPNPSQPTP